jgi:TPR repeat protein
VNVISRRLAIGIKLTVLVLASIALQQKLLAASDAAVLLLESLEASKPDWLPDLAKCPIDVMPARETKLDYSSDRCATDLERCLDNCRAGDASDCYASALILQRVRNNPISEALFLKACSLGIVSGCTNRAASMENSGRSDCVVQTFQRGCDHNDPWACTMFGFHLVRGIGIAKDRERARQVLSKSCRFGETDKACLSGRGLLKEIGD